MTAADLRRIALTLEGVQEYAHAGLPAFRVGGRDGNYVRRRAKHTYHDIECDQRVAAASAQSESSSPNGVAITPDGTRVYETNQNSSTVSVIDTATNTVVATVPIDGSVVTRCTRMCGSNSIHSKAKDYSERALEIHGNYARAHSGLAEVLLQPGGVRLKTAWRPSAVGEIGRGKRALPSILPTVWHLVCWR